MKNTTDEPIALPLIARLLRRCSFPYKLGIMDRIFAGSLSNHGIAWVETACGETWKLDLTNSTHRWMVYGDYEGSSFLNWVRSNVPPTGVIVDSGANIGQMAVYFGVVVGGGRVYAFEPGPGQFAWLTECLTRNPHLPITPLQIGLSDNSRTAFLSNDGNPATHGSWSKVSEKEGERIRLTTLDEFLTQRGIRHVHLWKLDMEGHEFNALKGASRALEAGSIGALYVEISGESGCKIAAFLKTFGYSPFYPDEKGVIHPALEWNNYDCVLFVRSR